MSCTDLVCGTGNWSGPKPGDPDNNVTLTAVPAFGGIDVEWTYPTTRPEAVAHTILLRSTAPNFLSAARHAIVSGNRFYDKTSSATAITYYYWIQLVSVNGTYGEVVGPASAIARPPILQMIEQLTQQIDAGFLAQSLRAEIDQIKLNSLAISQEMLDRDAADDALGVAFNEVQAHSEQSRALLQEEVLARTAANEAFVSTVNTLYAELGEGLDKAYAAVQQEASARVTGQQALAKQITTVQSSLEGQLSSVEQSFGSSIERLDSGLTKVSAQYTAKVSVDGLIGGFGLYGSSDGLTKEIQAGFDVDTFWIGRSGANKRKPFMVVGQEIFMDQAAIYSLVFNKLRDESGNVLVKDGKLQAKYLEVGDLQSLDYQAGLRGWKLSANGDFEINGGVAGEGRITQTNQVIKIFDGNNRLRVKLGNLKK